MRRFILDTGIVGLHLDRKRGVFERRPAGARRLCPNRPMPPTFNADISFPTLNTVDAAFTKGGHA